MPARWSRCASSRPAGPAPTMPDLGLHQRHSPAIVRARAAGTPGHQLRERDRDQHDQRRGPVARPVVHGAEQPRAGRGDEVADAQRHRGQRRRRSRASPPRWSGSISASPSAPLCPMPISTIHSGAAPGAASTPTSPAAATSDDRRRAAAIWWREPRGDHRDEERRQQPARATRSASSAPAASPTSRRPRGSTGSTTATRRTPSTGCRRRALTDHASGRAAQRARRRPRRHACRPQRHRQPDHGGERPRAAPRTASDAAQPPSALASGTAAPGRERRAEHERHRERAGEQRRTAPGSASRISTGSSAWRERDRRPRRSAPPANSAAVVPSAAQRRRRRRSADRAARPARARSGRGAASRGASGANAPMHSTGSVVSSPAAAAGEPEVGADVGDQRRQARQHRAQVDREQDDRERRSPRPRARPAARRPRPRRTAPAGAVVARPRSGRDRAARPRSAPPSRSSGGSSVAPHGLRRGAAGVRGQVDRRDDVARRGRGSARRSSAAPPRAPGRRSPSPARARGPSSARSRRLGGDRARRQPPQLDPREVGVELGSAPAPASSTRPIEVA